MAKQIYILEDDQGIREILELILTDEGFEVKSFSIVKDFNEELLHSIPDLYLLDVMLPDGNGIEVCKALKSRQKTAEVPVMMMSAHVDVELMQKSCGAQGHLAKPFDIYKLIDQIRKITG